MFLALVVVGGGAPAEAAAGTNSLPNSGGVAQPSNPVSLAAEFVATPDELQAKSDIAQPPSTNRQSP